jgi:hypothetical protein
MPLDPVVWPGCVYAWLRTSATVDGLARGRAYWAAGQIGEWAHPVSGCPQRMVHRRNAARYPWPTGRRGEAAAMDRLRVATESFAEPARLDIARS